MNVPSQPPPPRNVGEVIAEAAEPVLRLYYERLELLCGAFLWKHKRIGVLVQEQSNGNTAVYFLGTRVVNKVPEAKEIAQAERSYQLWKQAFPFEPEDAMVLFIMGPGCPVHEKIAYEVQVVQQPANLVERVQKIMDERDKYLQTLN